MRPYVVSHLNAKLQNWRSAGIYFSQENSRNLHRSAGLLIKCNSFAEYPKFSATNRSYSPSLLISRSVTTGPVLVGQFWGRVSTMMVTSGREHARRQQMKCNA